MRSISESAYAITALLADGDFHSGEKLAQRLKITRAAVWKQVKLLESLGLEISSTPGRGYRLAQKIDLLDAAGIRQLLPAECAKSLHALNVLNAVDSTNSWLSAQSSRYPAVCLAEMQSGGRGRRGRKWVSPYAANLYLSMGWQFDDVPPGFTALGMVAAIASVRALLALRIPGVGIKWPNDLLVNGKKLGGILVDIQGEPPNRIRTVVGIGINVKMPKHAASHIEQPWTDLATLVRDEMPQRNYVAAAVIGELAAALQTFSTRGFGAFVDDWRSMDLTAGKPVQLYHQHQVINGKAAGVDQDGALLMQTETGIRRFVSGDLSLRLQP